MAPRFVAMLLTIALATLVADCFAFGAGAYPSGCAKGNAICTKGGVIDSSCCSDLPVNVPDPSQIPGCASGYVYDKSSTDGCGFMYLNSRTCCRKVPGAVAGYTSLTVSGFMGEDGTALLNGVYRPNVTKSWGRFTLNNNDVDVFGDGTSLAAMNGPVSQWTAVNGHQVFYQVSCPACPAGQTGNFNFIYYCLPNPEIGRAGFWAFQKVRNNNGPAEAALDTSQGHQCMYYQRSSGSTFVDQKIYPGASISDFQPINITNVTWFNKNGQQPNVQVKSNGSFEFVSAEWGTPAPTRLPTVPPSAAPSEAPTVPPSTAPSEVPTAFPSSTAYPTPLATTRINSGAGGCNFMGFTQACSSSMGLIGPNLAGLAPMCAGKCGKFMNKNNCSAGMTSLPAGTNMSLVGEIRMLADFCKPKAGTCGAAGFLTACADVDQAYLSVKMCDTLCGEFIVSSNCAKTGILGMPNSDMSAATNAQWKKLAAMCSST